jgi:hypothetical protein
MAQQPRLPVRPHVMHSNHGCSIKVRPVRTSVHSNSGSIEGVRHWHRPATFAPQSQ